MNDESFIAGNAKVVRSINRAMILNLIRTKQPIPRTEIARITGLNKSTVSSIVSGLLQENLVYEQLTSDQNVGRNPVNLFLRKNRYYAGAINIDRELATLAVVDVDGSIIGTATLRTSQGDLHGFIRQAIEEIKRLCRENEIRDLEGIGLTIGGIVDPGNRILSYRPGKRWEDFDVCEAIKKEWPELKIVSVGNDAKSCALAELWFGSSAANLSSFVFVLVGHAINSGIVIDDRLLDGGSQASGEFGHITIIEGGEECECGNNGCWEKYASDSATLKRYRERLSGAKNGKVTLKAVIDSAVHGNKVSIATLKETGYYLGLGIANIIRSIDPKAVILSGNITLAWDIIYPEIIKVLKERAFSGRERDIQIMFSSLSENSRLLGAATLVIKEIFDYYRITSE
ncbi:MAG: ROK family transcriptional regulator [Ignavibacteria bacterium]|jgi:predicted NBD/HSP70 family sugar kinase|nr:ROK family transcriptional regulator [Ignavibacteria bacterium]MCU7502859.1 ROK family transcriptional regulator [Ignavibacteria bacterium]MCU7515647.1 ROK family transcriptional regulator [Ignavibacteria bacterium]